MPVMVSNIVFASLEQFDDQKLIAFAVATALDIIEMASWNQKLAQGQRNIQSTAINTTQFT
jgi:hypothetical protein